jgi:hypothetical protein
MKDQLFHHVWHALPWPALAALLHCFLLALGLRWYQALAGAVACCGVGLGFFVLYVALHTINHV